MPLQSISGGTDIVGCFVLGNPNLPVHRGWIQCRSLGLDVQALSDSGDASGTAVGELVCRNPFPSRPLGLRRRRRAARFHDAYFGANPGVWTHGDVIELDAEGQARIHGRSDGVLHIHGVRIGPSEIYRALRDVPEVARGDGGRAAERRGPRRLAGRAARRPPRAAASSTAASRCDIRRAIVQPRLADARAGAGRAGRRASRHPQRQALRAGREGRGEQRAGGQLASRSPTRGCLEEIRRAVAVAVERRRDAGRSGGSTPASGPRRRGSAIIWESVLGVAPLTPDDNFFDVGGTSLAAVRLFQGDPRSPGSGPAALHARARPDHR